MNDHVALALTGERTLPGIWHENYWFRRHEAAYRWLVALPGLTRGTVLEAGAGEGYGAEILRVAGAQVVAIDYDSGSAQHLVRAYPGIPMVRGNLVALPMGAATFDSVVSLQTIEHLWDQPLFVAECARVLQVGGLLAVSTPNRLTFSPGVGRGQKPLNPFHINEFDADELVELMAARVTIRDVVGVQHGERIVAWESAHGSIVAAQLATPYDQWQPHVQGLVASLSAADFIVSPSDIDASLDLLVVGTA